MGILEQGLEMVDGGVRMRLEEVKEGVVDNDEHVVVVVVVVVDGILSLNSILKYLVLISN